MGARLRSWWQQVKQRRVTIMVVATILVIAVALIIVVAWFYGTGFNGYNQITIAHTISGPSTGTVVRTEVSQPGKTIWDWLQLLIIPLALAVIAIFFNRSERKNEQRIASDNQQETALQEYIKEMSELLLHENLLKSQPEDEVRNIARVRTLTILPRLNEKRKRTILKFLFEANLINRGERIVDLSGVDLSCIYFIESWRDKNIRRYKLNFYHISLLRVIESNMNKIDMSEANLFKADLRGAVLVESDLSGASLQEANLTGANLHCAVLCGINLTYAKLLGTDLSGANLSRACLIGADLTDADLSGANLREAQLNGAILYDAILRGADMSGVDMREVKVFGLSETEVDPEQLKQAKSLEGATMPNGSIHE